LCDSCPFCYIIRAIQDPYRAVYLNHIEIEKDGDPSKKFPEDDPEFEGGLYVNRN